MYDNWEFRKFMKKRNDEANKLFWAKWDKKILNALVDDEVLEEKYRIK